MVIELEMKYSGGFKPQPEFVATINNEQCIVGQLEMKNNIIRAHVLCPDGYKVVTVMIAIKKLEVRQLHTG